MQKNNIFYNYEAIDDEYSIFNCNSSLLVCEVRCKFQVKVEIIMNTQKYDGS